MAPLLAAIVASVVGVLMGLSALCLRGLSLGLVTLAFAYAIEAVWFRNTGFVSTDGGRVTQPSLLGFDLGGGSGTPSLGSSSDCSASRSWSPWHGVWRG